MAQDWIDEEHERRQHGLTRALSQSQHAAVNARYPGCTLEYCVECGTPTGRAGRGEDSLYCESCAVGPLCWPCFEPHDGDAHAHA